MEIDFVAVLDRAQLGELVRRVRDGRLRTNIGSIATLDDAVAALNPAKGKTIIRVRRDACRYRHSGCGRGWPNRRCRSHGVWRRKVAAAMAPATNIAAAQMRQISR